MSALAVAMAEAQLSSAEAALTALYRGPQTTAEAAAKAELADAQTTLRQARSAYNEVAWSSDVGKLPQSFELEQATNAYEAAARCGGWDMKALERTFRPRWQEDG